LAQSVVCWSDLVVVLLVEFGSRFAGPGAETEDFGLLELAPARRFDQRELSYATILGLDSVAVFQVLVLTLN
jgi:hypothetical protein